MSDAWVVLLPATLVAVTGALYRRETAARSGEASLRRAALSAALIVGASLAVSTECLSLLGRLDFFAVGSFWTLALGTSLAGWGLVRFPGARWALPSVRSVSGVFPWLAALCLLFAATALTAFVSPPNNYDSMVYHSSRVAHWIQSGSLDVFPTHYLHEVWTTPWAEFAVLHLHLLAGSDRYANFVQWAAMCGSVIGVSWIARQLGAGVRGQALASVWCATIPMGILQSTSTQNDYVAGFWLVCLTASVLEAARSGADRRSALKVGTSLGLALLTKGTSYLYAPVLLAGYAVIRLRKEGLGAWKPLGAAVAVALLLNAGYYGRNLELSRASIVPPTKGITVRTFGPALLASNVLRNAALHGATPFRQANRALERLVERAHRWLGVDSADGRVTEANPVHRGFGLSARVTHEDHAGNPLHFLLAVFAAAAFIFNRRLERGPLLRGYLTGCAAAAMLLCLLIKWNPYNSRYHLPIFVLLSPFVGVVYAALPARRAVNALWIGLVLASLYWVSGNATRPWRGDGSIFRSTRTELYFKNRPRLLTPSLEAVSFLRSLSCRRIGLYVTSDHWEYPFWVLLQAGGPTDLQIEHVGVEGNRTRVKAAVAPYDRFEPCAVLCIDGGKMGSIDLRGRSYAKAFVSGPVSVYTPE